ncbi:SPFH domain-containing protein [Rhodovarius crocodyli]|uniref:SPFH domain-containing protein n=1 Tax=Rhodovarius crocodyli TaxID=1979269 RepID=UPI001F0CB0B3|nr:SPFH domain-containing protein [Rhodovarius crocodyli]
MEILLTILVVLAALVAYKGIKTVPQGESWTVERFGAYTRLLEPGLSFIVPFVEGIGRKVNIQEVVLDIPEQSVITGDNVSVLVDGIVYYRVLEPAKAAYAVQSMQSALTSLAMTNIRAVIGEMELDATLSGRERINSQLLKTLDGATEPWGVKVSRVEIKKVEPPESLSRAMAMQMTAERERRAAVVRAEGERQAAVTRAEGEKMATVLEAEGEREAAFRAAEARERLAEAEAKATRMVAEAAQGGNAALSYFIAQKYVEAVQALAAAPGKTTLVVPLETAGFAGGIAQALEAMRLPTPSDGAPASPVPPATPRSVPSAGSPFAPPGPR